MEKIIIDEEQADVVSTIFGLYLSGFSIVLIIWELEKKNIKSSQGKDMWSKRGIQTVLTNEKYIGQVLLGKMYAGDFPNNKQHINRGEQEQFLIQNAHEPIIKHEEFERVQAEIKCRSNVEMVNGKAKRKGTHYSTKSAGYD